MGKVNGNKIAEKADDGMVVIVFFTSENSVTMNFSSAERARELVELLETQGRVEIAGTGSQHSTIIFTNHITHIMIARRVEETLH